MCTNSAVVPKDQSVFVIFFNQKLFQFKTRFNKLVFIRIFPEIKPGGAASQYIVATAQSTGSGTEPRHSISNLFLHNFKVFRFGVQTEKKNYQRNFAL